MLRPIESRDYPALAHLFADPTTMGPFRDVMDELEVRLWIASSRSLHGEYGLGEFAVIDRAHRRLIGNIGVTPSPIDPNGRSFNMSWVVHHAYQGRGVATEAAAIVAQHAFECGVITLQASMAIEHVASRRVASKIGMEFQRVHRHPNDERWQHTLYEMHLLDWLALANATASGRSERGS